MDVMRGENHGSLAGPRLPQGIRHMKVGIDRSATESPFGRDKGCAGSAVTSLISPCVRADVIRCCMPGCSVQRWSALRWCAEVVCAVVVC